jgi:transcriptional regulator with XRE-family HTH domain
MALTSRSLAATFAKELRAARRTLGWTQADLAERAGIAVEVCGRLERGHVLPRAETLVRLAAALRVSSDSLLGIAPATGSAAERAVGEPPAAYGDPPELRRLVRRLRNEPRRTVRLLEAFVSSLQAGGRQRKPGR